jgi:signal transduction histidine kinase/ligand-binding sensor domain-containing protein
MWFGTQDGLNKFDGYSFTVYRHDAENENSLSNNSVAAIYEDKSGTLWVGTTGGGLNRFNRTTETFNHYLHDAANPHSLSGNSVAFIQQADAGAVWVATNHALDLFNPQTGEFTHYKNPSASSSSFGDTALRWICEDEKGALWIGTAHGGLQRFDRRTGEFNEQIDRLSESQHLRDFPISSILKDANGLLWIGTEGGGLFSFDRQSEAFTRYQHDPKISNSLADNTVSAMFEDAEGTFWIGTNNGLDAFDRKNHAFLHYRHEPSKPESISSNSIVSLYEDRSGILWIGTSEGINKLNRNNRHFISQGTDTTNANSLSGNGVRSLYQDRMGKLWIGTDDSGLNQYDKVTGEIKRYQYDASDPHSLSNNDATAIAEDGLGTLWIGTNGGGLNRFNASRGDFTRYRHDRSNPQSLSDDTVWSILTDSSGTLWIGTANGLNKFDHQSGAFARFQNDPANPRSLSDNNIRAIEEGKSGTLWLGTRNGGVNRFDSRSGGFKRFQHQQNNPASLSSDAVYALHYDSRGTLWVGTTEGFNRLNPDQETFIHFGEKDGLSNNTIYGILGDLNGNLWMSTNNGISRFNPETHVFRNYDVDDGLQDNEFNGGAAFQSKSGEMFFGGIKGFNSFHAEEVKDNAFRPPIVLTAFKKLDEKVKLNKSIDEIDEIELSYKDYVFSFEFAALDYTAPKKNQYAYKLDGFDQNWNYSGTRRVAIYTNLGGGDYVFKVKGTNSDGVWNEQDTSIRITIIPPFWKTWWFMALAVGAIVLLGIALYRQRISRLYRARAAQEAFSRQLIESQENERKRIAAELHDSLGQNLLIIKNRALLGLTPNASQTFSSEQLNEISTTASQAIEEVRQIARNLRPYKLDRLGLTKALESVIEQAANSSEISFSSQIDPVNGLFSKEAEINLYRIVQESLNNILKHSQATGVHLLMKREDKSVRLEIQDNGVGFDTEAVTGEDADRRGFGLAGISERARIIGGKYSMRSSPGNGTTITLKIELRDNSHES